MKRILVTGIVILNLSLLCAMQGQSYFAFDNYYPPAVDAPVFDAQGVPLAGNGYLAELWGGPTQDSLSPLVLLDQGYVRVIKPFVADGYVFPLDNGLLVVPDVPPYGWAWLQVRAWDAGLGATYEEASALGIGGYGESRLFYAGGSDPLSPNPTLPGLLIGLESFSLRPVIPEPSTLVLLVLGGTALAWNVKRRRRE